jgi:hypothetical protein
MSLKSKYNREIFLADPDTGVYNRRSLNQMLTDFVTTEFETAPVLLSAVREPQLRSMGTIVFEDPDDMLSGPFGVEVLISDSTTTTAPYTLLKYYDYATDIPAGTPPEFGVDLTSHPEDLVVKIRYVYVSPADPLSKQPDENCSGLSEPGGFGPRDVPNDEMDIF